MTRLRAWWANLDDEDAWHLAILVACGAVLFVLAVLA